MTWKPGEHVVIVGMNGSGKTTLARTLLDRRRWRIMLVTKPDDLTWNGWRTVSTADAIRPRPAEHAGQTDRGTSWRVYPAYEKSGQVFAAVFGRVWREGSWCLYADEAYHVQRKGLEDQLIKLLTQGRSKRITVVSGVQRPSWITRFVFSESSHVFCFQCGDRRDLKALRDGISDEFAEQVVTLKRYEFVYYNKVSRRMVRGTVRTLDQVLGG